jgi:hypothetical protein
VRSTIDPARLAELNAMRLAAIAGDRGAEFVDRPQPFGSGAAGISDDAVAWVLAAGGPGQSGQFGGALAWALRRGARALQLVAETDTGAFARRAQWFDFPVAVSTLVGRDLVDAIVEPLVAPPLVPAAHLELAKTIEAAGATVIDEHGVLAGEVEGLEVCRVIDDPDTGEVRLAVGIGAADREMFQLVHSGRATVDALADVVRSVAPHRAHGAVQHPLNTLAASRLIRARLLADPSIVGSHSLVPAEPPIARANLKDQVPCAAIDPASRRLIVCCTGVDLDVTAWAGDAIAMHDSPECVIVAPARDVIDIQLRLAKLLKITTSFQPM